MVIKKPHLKNIGGSHWQNLPLITEDKSVQQILDAVETIIKKYPNSKFRHTFRTGEKFLNQTRWAEKNGTKKIKNKLVEVDKVSYEKYKKDFANRGDERKGVIPNTRLIEKFKTLGITCYPEGDTKKGSMKPDGGVLEIQLKDGSWEIILISEVKSQDDNPGNALERAHSNISGFSVLCNNDIFPYYLICTGNVVNPSKNSYIDRITRTRGFFKLNQVNTNKVSKTDTYADIRPITVTWKKDLTESIEVYNNAVDIATAIIGDFQNASKL